jgi:hypothetical protein
MQIRILLLTVLFGGAQSFVMGPPIPGSEFCPASAPGHVQYVQRFFVAEETRPFREQFGLLAVVPGDVRILTDARDADACRRLSQAVTLDQSGPYPKVWRGFKAGNFYIMSVTTQIPSGVFYHGGGNGLIILNSDFEIIAAAS